MHTVRALDATTPVHSPTASPHIKVSFPAASPPTQYQPFLQQSKQIAKVKISQAH